MYKISPRTTIAFAMYLTSVTSRALPQYDSPQTNPPPFPTDGSIPPFPLPPAHYPHVRLAHAILASIAWLIFFPLGAILIRTLETSRSVQIHYILQLAGYVVFIAAAGMGIWMANTIHVLHMYHPVIGLTLLGCLAIQPLTELANNFFFNRFPKIILLAHVHIWFGRLLITFGIIEGGLGFVFSAGFPMAIASPAPRVVYGVVAVVVWILYISLAIVWPEVKHTFAWWQRRQEGRRSVDDGERLRNRSLAGAEMGVEGVRLNAEVK